jgi:hypothetical protein
MIPITYLEGLFSAEEVGSIKRKIGDFYSIHPIEVPRNSPPRINYNINKEDFQKALEKSHWYLKEED